MTPTELLSRFDDTLARIPAGQPSLLAVTGASNVTGEVWPIAELAALAHRRGARILVDCAQLAPHRAVDIAGLDLDWVALSGHKLYAPFGSGALVGRPDGLDRADPYLAGGGSVAWVTAQGAAWTGLPDRHEGGSPNVVGAFAMAAACSELRRIGMDAIAVEERRLGDRLRARLAEVPGLVSLPDLAGASRPRRASPPSVSNGRDHAEVATVLSAEHGIGVRSGSFCAHPLLAHIAGGAERLAAGLRRRRCPAPSGRASAWAAGRRTSTGSPMRCSRSPCTDRAGPTGRRRTAPWSPTPTTVRRPLSWARCAVPRVPGGELDAAIPASRSRRGFGRLAAVCIIEDKCLRSRAASCSPGGSSSTSGLATPAPVSEPGPAAPRPHQAWRTSSRCRAAHGGHPLLHQEHPWTRLTILGGELAGATEPTAAGESPGATGPAAAVTSPGVTEAATGSSGSTGSAAFPADQDRALVRALIEHRRTQVARLPSRKRVETFVDSAVGLLFPQHSAESRASEDQLLARITLLRAELASMLRAVLPRERSDEVAEALTRALPAIYDRLRADAAAIVEGDPAAESLDEVIAAYPGFFAITVHRIAHELHRLGAPTLPRLLAEVAHARTGIDIHPGATVGRALCIDHGTGIVIGETAIIGDDVKLYQGVTLGALSVVKIGRRVKKRHPTIEDRVVLYANATVLGGDTVVGHDSVIGGNVWLTTSVPPHSFVYHTSQIRVRSVADALGNSDYSI